MDKRAISFSLLDQSIALDPTVSPLTPPPVCQHYIGPLLSFAFGASRGVALLPDQNFVIKWDLPDAEGTTAHEFFLYEKAKAAHIEQMFARPEYLGLFHDQIEIWAYPRAEPLSSRQLYQITPIHPILHKSPLAVQEPYLPQLFLHAYGAKNYRKLEHFLLDHNIIDLHAGNIMQINHLPIIIDYSFPGGDSYADQLLD